MSPFQSRCHNGRASPASNRSCWLTLRPEGCGNGAAAGRPRLVQTQCWCPHVAGTLAAEPYALVVSVA